VGMVFLFVVHMLAKPLRSELTNNTCQTKDGLHFLPSILNAIIGITSHFCAIMKIVILHVGIKTIQNVFFSVFLKRAKYLVSFKKNGCKKTGGLFFLKMGLFQPCHE